MVMPNGNSYTPGFSQSPDTLNSLWPVELLVPMLLNQSTPLTMMQGTQARVSTLLTTDGRLRKPDTTGNGGRLRGSPRNPSSDSMRAVSSPHTYAPAPMATMMLKLKPLMPPMSEPSRPAALRRLTTSSR